MSEARRLGTGGALLWAAVAILGAWGVLEGLAALRPATRTDLVSMVSVRAAVLIAGAFAVLRIHAPERTARDGLGLRPTSRVLMALSLLLGVALAPPVAMLDQLVLDRFALTERELILRALLARGSTPAAAVGAVVASVCVGPLVSELFFRGALFSTLHRSAGLGAAALVSVLGFAFSTADLRAVPGLLLVGSAQALVRSVSGSLVPCIALHVALGASFAMGRLWGAVDVMGHLKLPALVAAGAWLGAALLAHAISSIARDSEDAERARVEDAS